MPAAKNKPRIQAGDVDVGNRTLEGVLLDLAEQTRENARLIQANAEQMKVHEARLATLEQQSAMALQTIAAMHRDLVAMTIEMREENRRHHQRITALEGDAASA